MTQHQKKVSVDGPKPSESGTFTIVSFNGSGLSGIGAISIWSRILEQLPPKAEREVNMWVGSGFGALVALLCAAQIPVSNIKRLLRLLCQFMFLECVSENCHQPLYSFDSCRFFCHELWGNMCLRDLSDYVFIPITRNLEHSEVEMEVYHNILQKKDNGSENLSLENISAHCLSFPSLFSCDNGYIGGGFGCPDGSLLALTALLGPGENFNSFFYYYYYSKSFF